MLDETNFQALQSQKKIPVISSDQQGYQYFHTRLQFIEPGAGGFNRQIQWTFTPSQAMYCDYICCSFSFFQNATLQTTKIPGSTSFVIPINGLFDMIPGFTIVTATVTPDTFSTGAVVYGFGPDSPERSVVLKFPANSAVTVSMTGNNTAAAAVNDAWTMEISMRYKVKQF